MTSVSMRQRAIRGAAEGAATGLAVAMVRVGMALYRKGLPESISAQVPELIVLFFVNVLCCGYLFAVGRALADGIAGSLLGAAILAVSGSLVGTLIPFGPTGPPYPIILGAVAGALIGSPIGAMIHRQFRKPHSANAE